MELSKESNPHAVISLSHALLLSGFRARVSAMQELNVDCRYGDNSFYDFSRFPIQTGRIYSIYTPPYTSTHTTYTHPLK
jgi:hypothetical protein